MNDQINLRLPKEFLSSAKKKAKEEGFSSVQEYIKNVLREDLFPKEDISKEELSLVKTLAKASEEKSLYGSEEELYGKLEE